MSFGDRRGGGYGGGGGATYSGGAAVRSNNPFGGAAGGGGGGVGGSTYQKPHGDADAAQAHATGLVRQLQANVTKLRKLGEQIGGESDTLTHRQHVRKLIDDTRVLLKDAMEALKRYASLPAADNRRKRAVELKLKDDLQRWAGEYKSVSEFCVKREQQYTPRTESSGARKTGGNADDWTGIGDAGGALSGGSSGVGGGYYGGDDERAGLLATEQQRAEFMQLEEEEEFQAAVIAEREEAIKEVQAAVVEVNQIFTDLAGLVQEQGVLVDNIESNISKADRHVEEAVGELEDATKYQKSARGKIICILITLCVLAGVAGIAIYLLLTFLKP